MSKFKTIIILILLLPLVIGVADKFGFDPTNYIQASHHDIIYSTNNGLKVPAIDYTTPITGSSMQPTLFTGNVIGLIDYKSKDQISEGDIIHFQYKDGTRIHRIKAIYNDYLLTQGDNTYTTEHVNYDDILGVGVAVIYK